MLNIEFKYKDIKPYQQNYKPTNKSNVPLLHEMHLNGIKQFPQKQKMAIEKLYEFPAPKSMQRGITRYDSRYTTGQIPNFNYKIEDIVEVDESEILDNFHQDKATAKVNYISVKPMSFRETQLNNMKEEVGVPNPLTALRANAEHGIGEAARLLVEAIRSTDVPVSTTVYRNTESRQRANFESDDI
jgi:hypothetical protein